MCLIRASAPSSKVTACCSRAPLLAVHRIKWQVYGLGMAQANPLLLSDWTREIQSDPAKYSHARNFQAQGNSAREANYCPAEVSGTDTHVFKFGSCVFHCRVPRKALSLPDSRSTIRWQCSRKKDTKSSNKLGTGFFNDTEISFQYILPHIQKRKTIIIKKKWYPNTFMDVTVLLLAWEPGKVWMTQWSNLSLQRLNPGFVWAMCQPQCATALDLSSPCKTYS